MLRLALLVAGVIAVAALLSACGDAAYPPPGTAEVPEPISPVTKTNPLSSTSSTSLPPTPPREISSGAASVKDAIDGSGDQAVPTQTVGQADALSGVQTTAMVVGSSAEDVATITGMVDAYWAAFNAYDADVAVSMLEASYRADEEELIRRDIGRMKLFRVQLDVSEEKALALTDRGDYETYLKIATPVDSRRLLMIFRHIEGRWWIVFSDEIE